MKVFVTGGSGFIGRELVRQLVARGDDVYALARSQASIEQVEGLGATAVFGDITDVASMRDGMTGSDLVFHLAAWYKVGVKDWEQAEVINVSGTRKVLRLAHRLGIPKIIYTSTVGVFGDTHGELVDESYYSSGPFNSEYERTKWLAHYKVALPLIERGAPITIVMPGGVYGPGDTSIIAEMMRLYYRGLPVVTGPKTSLTYAHVSDVAAGHILAADSGVVGESYILTGPDVQFGDMVNFWAELTNRPSPKIHIPTTAVQPFVPIVRTIGNIVPLPPAFSAELMQGLGATYNARSDKARQELGWETRPLQTGMLETFDWIANTESTESSSEQKLLLGILGLSLVLGVAWLFKRSRNRK